MMQTYTFACVHNAGRSQMAAAFLDPAKAEAISAGPEPGPVFIPSCWKRYREVGVDLSSTQRQLFTEELARTANLLIMMGAARNVPIFQGSTMTTGRFRS